MNTRLLIAAALGALRIGTDISAYQPAGRPEKVARYNFRIARIRLELRDIALRDG